MPWIHKQSKAITHSCDRPDSRGTRRRQSGDVWQCPRCGMKWRLLTPGKVCEAWTDTPPAWERLERG